MAAPIRARWLARPGWSEFGAPRPGSSWGTHQGFDYYCVEGTPIYARGNGRVAGRGFHDGGYGNYVDVAYPGSVVVRASHMQSGSPLAYGNPVDEDTVIGYVGKTGNAAGIVWYVGGQALRHLHEEVRVSGRLVDPLGWGVSPAGGGTVTPITPEIEDDMFSDEDRARQIRIEQMLTETLDRTRKERDALELVSGPDGTVWFCFNRIWRYAIPSEANLATYQAHMAAKGYDTTVTARKGSDLTAWGSPCYSDGARIIPFSVQEIARAVPTSGAAPASFDALVTEIGKLIPTADQNGAAARAAIVK